MGKELDSNDGEWGDGGKGGGIDHKLGGSCRWTVKGEGHKGKATENTL
jgi:hypothetical protein